MLPGRHFIPALRTLASGLLLSAALLAAPAQADDLRDALVSVYKTNPRLQAERARLRETDETYVQARAQGRPQISGSASISKAWARFPLDANFGAPPTEGGGSGEKVTFTDTPNDIGVQIVQPIYQGGRVKALREQATLGVLAAREGLRAQENALFQQAADAYVTVRRDIEAARIRRTNVRVIARQLEAAQVRFDVGQGTRTDIAQSEARLALAEAGLAQADAQLAVSRAAYRRVVGRAPDNLAPPPRFALPGTLAEAITAARENNPQLLGAYYAEAAGRKAVDVAKAASRPTFSVSGGLIRQRNQLSNIQEIDSAQILGTLTVPIYSGGANASRRRQAEHAKTRLLFETRDAELAVDQSVANLWANLAAARAVLTAARRQQSAAQTAFEGVTLEQSVGTRDQLDVLNAEQEVLNASLSVIDAQRSVDSATFGLLAVMGVFDAEGVQLDVENYDPALNLEAIRNDGLERTVDAYVPEFAQRIVRQVPDLAGDVVDAAETVYEDTPVKEIVALPVELVGVGARAVTSGVNAVTGLSPERDSEVVVELPSNPALPKPSATPPPYDPLLDSDADGAVDVTYLPDASPAEDSPVD